MRPVTLSREVVDDADAIRLYAQRVSDADAIRLYAQRISDANAIRLYAQRISDANRSALASVGLLEEPLSVKAAEPGNQAYGCP